MAGKDIQRLSPIFILTAQPSSINRPSPADDINKIGLNLRPTSKPIPPNNSSIAVSTPTFSRPNRWNSSFMLGVTKYVMP